MKCWIDTVREVQSFAARQLSPEAAQEFTDVEQWKLVQLHLATALRELEAVQGDTPEVEGELVLALLMGYGVTVRNGARLACVLERAEQVLPRITDPVLKCKLTAYCYVEVPDEELLDMARSLLLELKQQGRGDEVKLVEEMIAE